MAKKAKAEENVEVAPQPAVQKPVEPKQPAKPSWEIKDRLYTLKGKNMIAYTSIWVVNKLKF